DVNYVMNFTDVDDKIIKAANDQGVEPSVLSKQFIEAFHEDTKALNVRKAVPHPTVTDNIQQIIEFNQELIDKGYAYKSDDDVYYRAGKFEVYGQLDGLCRNGLSGGQST